MNAFAINPVFVPQCNEIDIAYRYALKAVYGNEFTHAVRIADTISAHFGGYAFEGTDRIHFVVLMNWLEDLHKLGR